MAQLILDNMEFYAFHGHYDEERKVGSRFTVDIIVETNIDEAVKTDRLEDALDYTTIYEAVKQEMRVTSRLLEHVAGRIVNKIHDLSNQISKVTVTVSKHNPSIGGMMDKFSVTYSI